MSTTILEFRKKATGSEVNSSRSAHRRIVCIRFPFGKGIDDNNHDRPMPFCPRTAA